MMQSHILLPQLALDNLDDTEFNSQVVKVESEQAGDPVMLRLTAMKDKINACWLKGPEDGIFSGDTVIEFDCTDEKSWNTMRAEFEKYITDKL